MPLFMVGAFCPSNGARIGGCSVSDASKTRLLDWQELSQQDMIDAAANFYRQMRKRRSVRDFADRPVPMQVVEHAIATAGTAPSGANQQPWHFAVTTDPQVKTQLREAAEREEREFYSRRATKAWLDALAPLGTNASKPFLETAPVLIGVFIQKSSTDEKRPAPQELLPYGVGGNRLWPH